MSLKPIKPSKQRRNDKKQGQTLPQLTSPQQVREWAMRSKATSQHR